jgi:Tfp pilus assembly protein PilF
MSSRYVEQVCLLLLGVCFVACNREMPKSSADRSEQFLHLMNVGKNFLDQGDATNALATYRKAQALVANDADLHLNLANAYLIAGASDDAVREADEALKLEPNLAAAYFVKGSASLRLSNFADAVKALENTIRIDPGEKATFFQLGRARMGLEQWDGAITAFREGLRMDPNRLHAGPRYLLAQSLIRAGRQDEATRELQLHQAELEGGAPTISAATFERSKFTAARVPFKLDQPEREGIKVRFVDATEEALGDSAHNVSGTMALIDPNRSGWNHLFVLRNGQFELLWNSNGVFRPHGMRYPSVPNATYSRMLVGDLQNDRCDDVVVLGENGSHLFKFDTNGFATDVSASNRFGSISASDGLLMDLDFTGKLDLLAVGSTNNVRLYRQFGSFLFNEITSTSGIPSSLQNAQAIRFEDWNRDGIMDVIASRKEGPPLLLEKQRGGPLVPREMTNWVAGTVFCTGDFDNDLRPDLAIASAGKIIICSNGGERREIALDDASVRQIVAIDYDNDGWLDLWTVGEKIRAWRNLGLSGFHEETTALGLDKFNGGAVSEIHFADFDKDCDSDAIVVLVNGGLRYLRNDGGNANAQFKVQLNGTRSNASGIGCKVEVETGRLRLLRTVQQVPVEIGVGKHRTLDSFVVHWFNWPQGSAEVPFTCREPLFALELSIQEGSCPYLYAWDGKGFRFITDILGAAPLGLPIAEGRYIEADPEELVWVGNEQTFPARHGAYELRLTEELREVLYLDEAKLVVVDHEPGTEVHSTDKLLPGRPFPKSAVMTLHNEHPLRSAETLDHRDVTSALRAVDGQRVSPANPRVPQLRGLAEPHGLILDFGPLDSSRPLVLVMNGWLRFGGGMANMAASHDPSLPFPFPVLEAEVAGAWQRVEARVGAPAGKTKTILVDLAGKLPAGATRLRLTEAFEIHWDRIALMEKKPDARTRITFVAPGHADLHFRGFSAIRNLPSDCPLTPDYDNVSPNSCWTITPGGWCTGYGDVSELVATRDEGLALLNGGDELALKFPAGSLPPKPAGTVREFFLYVDGWDKDSDFHVAAGTQVGPLPFHGMDDQLYGSEKRPAFPTDALHRKYNTRWVEGQVLRQTAGR